MTSKDIMKDFMRQTAGGVFGRFKFDKPVVVLEHVGFLRMEKFIRVSENVLRIPRMAMPPRKHAA